MATDKRIKPQDPQGEAATETPDESKTTARKTLYRGWRRRLVRKTMWRNWR